MEDAERSRQRCVAAEAEARNAHEDAADARREAARISTRCVDAATAEQTGANFVNSLI